MRKFFLFIVPALFFFSCKKSEVVPKPSTHPVMRCKDLQNAEVIVSHSQSVDIDNDGTKDFAFSVLLVGDPILQRDRLQFIAHSKIDDNLLNNDEDQSPVLNRYDLISETHQGYQWYEISAIVLAEKITTMTNVFWEGLWKNALHKYLPVQIKRNNKLYHGWIELSFDTAAEKLILHRSAISTEAGKDVKAGY
jgi:hypothetical protein